MKTMTQTYVKDVGEGMVLVIGDDVTVVVGVVIVGVVTAVVDNVVLGGDWGYSQVVHVVGWGAAARLGWRPSWCPVTRIRGLLAGLGACSSW